MRVGGADHRKACRFGNLRDSRLGSLRYGAYESVLIRLGAGQLAQDEGQNSAVLVVINFDGRIDAAGDRDVFRLGRRRG